MTEQLRMGGEGFGESPIPDYERTFRLAGVLGVEDGKRITYLVIDGDPRPKARTRFSSGGKTYTLEEQRQAERDLGWEFKRSFKKPLPYTVAVVCIFYRSNYIRVDVDNMLKHVMDSANGIVWEDDSQVTAQLGIMEYDPDHPRTVILIGEHRSTMQRPSTAIRVCKHCGKEFRTPRVAATFCSQECQFRGRKGSLHGPVPCPECGKGFKRRNRHQKFCSHECYLDSRYGRRQ